MNKIDHLVTADENRRLGIPTPSIPEPKPDLVEHVEPQVEAEQPVEIQVDTVEHSEDIVQDPYLNESHQVKAEAKESKESKEIDEYGNKVKEKKTYTEDEVQRMIRERISRIKAPAQSYEDQFNYSQQTQPQQPQKQEEVGEGNWEKELETFIDRRLEQKKASEQQRIWQEREIQKQIEFEQKFSTGMERYSDFREVVANKPITDSMMLSIRNLDNPAAFVYGASKLHPGELDKIARIEDPYIQAAEMGKLHERMIKDRKIASSAPKPIDPPKGDLGLKNSTEIPTNYASSEYQRYITQRLNEYAKQKIR